jgi:hypothetical protein
MTTMTRIAALALAAVIGCGSTHDSLGTTFITDGGVGDHSTSPGPDGGSNAPVRGRPVSHAEAGMRSGNEPTDAGADAPTGPDGSALSDAGHDAGCIAAASCDPYDELLESYCKLEHAQCPRTTSEGMKLVCNNRFASSGARFKNTCGGVTLRMQFSYGMIDYLYDAAGKLSAIDTVGDKAAGPCHSIFYHYGDVNCRNNSADSFLVCNLDGGL